MRSSRYESFRLQVDLDYDRLSDGETANGEICPACEGGSTKERSFSVSRRGGVLRYRCHRASCGFSGTNTTASPHRGSVTQPNTSGSSIKGYVPSLPINEATARFLAAKFNIPAADFRLAGVRWTGEANDRYGRRVCYPIDGPDSRKRGESYRSYVGAVPKNIIHFGTEDAIALAWYKWKRASKSLVIVEDQVSAIKLAPYLHAVALLGTNLSEAKVEEIREEGYDHIHLALDNDATMEAVKAQLKWQHRLPQLCVRGLAKDIKDMNDEEFTALLPSLTHDPKRAPPSAGNPAQ